MSGITISANKGKKAFKCSICDKIFPQKFHMERHKVVDHNIKKTFKSKIYDERLAVNPNMNKHMTSVHEGKKEVKCKTKIAKSMPAKGQLISKCPFGVKTSSKKTTIFFQDFCTSLSKNRSNQKCSVRESKQNPPIT
jgi:hypothetical protein